MHTLKVIAAGIVLLGLLLVLARWLGGSSSTAGRVVPYFLGLWLLASVANLAVGVWKAGYSVSDELPILLVVFAVPAALALVIGRWLTR